MQALSATQNFNNLVALFLAEAMRSRRTSLSRAAEISQRVVRHIKDLNSESSVLALLTGLEKDFQEISTLKEALHFGYQLSDVKVFEAEIKEYASKIFTQDLNLSARFLEDAAAPGATIQQLCIKYPQFCQFLMASSEKARLLGELSPKA